MGKGSGVLLPNISDGEMGQASVKEKKPRKDKKREKTDKKEKKERREKKEKREKKDKKETRSRKRKAEEAGLQEEDSYGSKKVKAVKNEGSSESGGRVKKDGESCYSLEHNAEDLSLGQQEVPATLVTNFGMSETTVKQLKSKGIENLFEIQAATYDLLRNQKKDVIARAKTGSGKTLAFVLPIVESLIEGSKRFWSPQEKPLVLVLAPTRELAQQVHRDFEYIGNAHGLSAACFYGGSSKGPQKGALRRGLDILVGTPGRIIDHMEEGQLVLSHVGYVVLDEADEMLSMGFQEDVEKILSACEDPHKQTLLFSATIPQWVRSLSKKYMREGATVTVDTVSDEVNRTNADIAHYAIACPWNERSDVLADVIRLHCGSKGKALIFTDTKIDANELSEYDKLVAAVGGIGVLHGDIPQAQRERTLQSYRTGKIRALVATDVAARGLDIEGVDLVLQTHPPPSYETYIHRSGRTGRAGKSGKCVTFYTPREKYLIGLIEHQAGIKFKRAAPPQPISVIKAGMADVIEKISSVHPVNVRDFRGVAKEVIAACSESNPERILAAALACMAGYTSERIKSRSLLSCFEGWIAVKMTSPVRLSSTGHAWAMIKRLFGPEMAAEVKGTKLCKDPKVAVFDIPQKYQDWLENFTVGDNNKRGVRLEVPETELPELQEDPFDLQDAQKLLAGRKSLMYQRRSGARNSGWGGWGGRSSTRATSGGRHDGRGQYGTYRGFSR